MNPITLKSIIFALLTMTFSLSYAETQPSSAQKLARQWAEIRYHLENDKREARFKALKKEAEQLTSQMPEDANVWVWSGIISSTYAGEAGGLTALSAVKQAKAAFEKSIDIDPTALGGSAYTSLGALYYQVPGWPLSFGDKEKAEDLLKKGLAMNENSIDANFFYADFLVKQGRIEEAKIYLDKAEKAAPRPNRAIADLGRRQEISKLRSTI